VIASDVKTSSLEVGIGTTQHNLSIFQPLHTMKMDIITTLHTLSIFQSVLTADRDCQPEALTCVTRIRPASEVKER
jgi:hypothetical protein